MSNQHHDPNPIRAMARRMVSNHSDQIRQVIQQRELSQLQGDRVFCPVCSSMFSAFAPLYQWIISPGDAAKECVIQHTEARCPKCQSLQRHRLLALILQNTLPVTRAPKMILDIAPFIPLAKSLLLTEANNYQAVDLHPENEKFSSAPFPVMPADLCELPFEDNMFDLILCSHVLEHIVDDTIAMYEMGRVLKPDGMVLIQIPANNLLEFTYEDHSITLPGAREAAFGQWDHVRVYGRDFPSRLKKAGFEPALITCSSVFDNSEIQRLGLDAHETLYLCKKPGATTLNPNQPGN